MEEEAHNRARTVPRVRVGAIDDHPVVLRGLMAALVEVAPDISCDFRVASLRDVDWDRVTRPDVLLLDISLNDGSSPEDNVRELVARGHSVLLFTSEERPALLRRLITLGARGLVLKSDADEALADAIRSVSEGNFATSSHLAESLLCDDSLVATLSQREMEVLEALAAGVPKKAIGKTLPDQLSAYTVDTYFQRIAGRYAALGRPVTNIYGSLREATRDGHLDL
ncbi:LuxR family two component transcriptional regulator [Rudaeicoccus suwonensis]|uniref:LuxR family two component transcriptional regulator n=2 Tax=Rudaeicoccus suwonensis TaxID=657409 RepID=A0A561E0S5_9MICO|nr:LuxR family two component transcriptional regulator [Rudaeicoccus suwonensis]